MNKKLIISLFGLLTFIMVNAQVNVSSLRCERLTDPMGIDAKEPRLSWQISSNQRNVQQTAYQIIVSSSKEKLVKSEGDLWNSGKVNSSQTLNVAYSGKDLMSKTQYYWKVKVFTTKGESVWSETAHWSMGLLVKNDRWGSWIGYDKASPWDSITQWSRLSARYFRKEFQQVGIMKRATVYICGLGLYELYINGNKIGDQVLAPAPTDYRKTVLYNTYDVTKNMNKDKNAIAVVLGNGRFFTMRQNYKTQKHNTFGFPKLFLQLEIEYTDGKKLIIMSDERWKLNVDGPIRTNNEYDGEEYDATKEFPGWTNPGFNDNNWMNAEFVDAPQGELAAQLQEPVKVMKKIKPVALKVVNGKYILDMGQNFSGWLQIKVNGKRGDKVQLRFAESLQPNGELYVANLRDARVTDLYALKGTGTETWHPTFVYHGFRYVEITGWPGKPVPENFEGHVVFDDLSTTGTFASSNETINAIHRNAWWGIASNYKGMPIDCPQRNERQPWLGDRAQGAYGESFLFNNASLYAKWLNDIEQSQTDEGAIPDVAPAFWNYYSDNVTWPGTYILVAEMLYKQFGDASSIVKHYASMKKWMNYMKNSYMKDFIVTKDKYGDWCVPPERLDLIRSSDSMRTTDGELLSTASYYHLLQVMKKFAALSGNSQDVKNYDQLADNIRNAFDKKFYNHQKGWYANNTVTANLLPLYFGITPDNLKKDVFNNIYNKITVENNMHISTGVIGTQWLMRGLTNFDHPDVAFALASNKTYPSWGYMVEQGATTIWELWNGNTANPQMNSQNHVMLLGDLLIWLYENIAGIKSDENDVAFKKIIMKPCLPAGLQFVNASYESAYGLIKSNWKKNTTTFEWEVSIPSNTSAVIYIPAKSVSDVMESGKDLSKSEGVQLLKWENGTAVIQLGSGHYQFKSVIK
jgi:alpha-L-rhamnosidase